MRRKHIQYIFRIIIMRKRDKFKDATGYEEFLVLKVSYTNKAGEEKTCENYTRISLE